MNVYVVTKRLSNMVSVEVFPTMALACDYIALESTNARRKGDRVYHDETFALIERETGSTEYTIHEKKLAK